MVPRSQMEMKSHFDTHGYEVVRGVLQPETLKLLTTEFKILREGDLLRKTGDPDNQTFGGDKQSPRSFSWFGAFCFEAVMLMVQPVVEKTVGKKLWPTYSYARQYWNGATLLKHLDRPACEFSATITVDDDGSDNWPIWMTSYDGSISELTLNPGDMCIYKGCELEHWREEYKGKGQLQTFVHYVDVYGPYADRKFDRRPMLGFPPVEIID